MKAAAPQAPGSAQATAKTSAKTPAKSAGAAAFAGLLAKAVSAKETASARPVVRASVSESSARNAKTVDAQAKTTARGQGRRRAEEAPAIERAAGHAVGRLATAVAQPAAAAAPPADQRAAAQAAAVRRSEPRVQVVDLRKRHAAADAPQSARSGQKAPSDKADGVAAAAASFTERLAAADAGAKPAPAARATPLERIREMTGSDLVRTVGLVVRDGGGEIRLTLKPESLGSVRIRLSIEDGKVEGRIVVDTPEARQAFEAGIDSLTRALQADGFQTGSLQVSVSGGNANDSRQAAGLLGDAIAGARARASDEAPRAAVPLAGWTGGGDGLVDVFA